MRTGRYGRPRVGEKEIEKEGEGEGEGERGAAAAAAAAGMSIGRVCAPRREWAMVQ